MRESGQNLILRGPSEAGFTVVESVIGFFLLGLVVLGSAQMFSGTNSAHSRDIGRWKAQLALESVSDLISSMSEVALTQMINDECLLPGADSCPAGRIGKAGVYYTATSNAKFAWISNWEEPGKFANIQVQFKVYSPAGVQLLARIAPPVSNFNIEIQTTGDFFRNPGQPAERLRWMKRLEHQ